MTFLYKIYDFICHNKYWFVAVCGVTIIGVAGENSIMRHLQYAEEISELEKEIAVHNQQYEEDTKMLKELRTNPEAIVRIAREQYYMKTDDEDIFILSTDRKKKKQN